MPFGSAYQLPFTGPTFSFFNTTLILGKRLMNGLSNRQSLAWGQFWTLFQLWRWKIFIWSSYNPKPIAMMEILVNRYMMSQHSSDVNCVLKVFKKNPFFTAFNICGDNFLDVNCLVKKKTSKSYDLRSNLFDPKWSKGPFMYQVSICRGEWGTVCWNGFYEDIS